MREQTRLAKLAVLGLTAASLAACSSYPLDQPSAGYPTQTYPTATYPAQQPYPQAQTYPAQPGVAQGTLWGRVTNIEYVQPGQAAPGGSPNILGAVVGGVAGAVLGRQVGGGSGRDAATVIGGLGGAAVGSQVGRDRAGGTTATAPAYRVTVVTDQGVSRMYEVAATGDLRVGDRVRIDNGVIYRV